MKNNFLATVLLGVIGLLLLVAAAQMFGLGSGVKDITAAEYDAQALSALTDKAQPELMDPKARTQAMDQIVAAPLFSNTRMPYVPPIDPDPTGGVEEPPASPLDAKVTSIVITGDASYVMIQDNVSNQRLTLAQGMPLEGEQGLWTVAAIEPRKVRFEAEGLDPVELELEVFSGSLGGGNGSNKGKRNKNKQKGQNNQKALTKNDSQQDERKNSAEEIRKKIAERRAEMRKKAAERNQQQ